MGMVGDDVQFEFHSELLKDVGVFGANLVKVAAQESKIM